MHVHNGYKLKQKMRLHTFSAGEEPLAQNEFLKAAELIKLEEAALVSGFSASYLRSIAQRGRLWAVKKGKHWFTTMAAVDEYKRSRYQIVKPV